MISAAEIVDNCCAILHDIKYRDWINKQCPGGSFCDYLEDCVVKHGKVITFIIADIRDDELAACMMRVREALDQWLSYVPSPALPPAAIARIKLSGKFVAKGELEIAWTMSRS